MVWRRRSDPEQLQPDTALSSLAGLLTWLTQLRCKVASLATFRRARSAQLNLSLERLFWGPRKSDCFDRHGSHSHQPGENLMITIFIRSTYIKKGPSAVTVCPPLCLHVHPPSPPCVPQAASPLCYLKACFCTCLSQPESEETWNWPDPSTCGSIPDRQILSLRQTTHNGFSHLIP